MPLRIDIDIEAKTRQAEERFRSLVQRTEELDRGLKQLSQDAEANRNAFQKAFSSDNLGGAFKWTELRSQISLVTGAVREFGQAMQQAFEFAAEGAGLQRIEDSFISLSTAAGTSSDELLSALDRAARGTVAQSDLILSANRAMMLGLGADADQLANLLEVAAFRGRAMGLSTTQAFNDIVTGVGRASPMILDNLGIVVDAERTYEAYATSIGKAKDELTKAEKTQALLTRVIEEGNRQMAEAGGLADDTATSYERLTAQSKNWFDELKKGAAEGLQPLVDGLSKWIEFEGRVRELQNDGVGRLQAAKQAWDEMRNATDEAADSTGDFTSATETVPTALENTEDALKANEEALKRQSDAYKTLLDNIFKIQDQSEKFAEGEEKRAEKLKELEEKKVQSTIERNKKIEELERDLDKARRDRDYSLSQIDKKAEDRSARAARVNEQYAERERDIQNRINELRDDAMMKQIDLNEQIVELEEQGTKAIQDKEKATKEMIYAQLEAKAAADGLVSAEETRFLQETAVQMGLVDQASADMAIAIAEAADAMWQSFEQPADAVMNIQELLDNVVKGSPYRAQILIEQVGGGYSTLTPAKTLAATRYRPKKLLTAPGYMGGFQEGGSFVVPGAGSGDRPYVVPLEPGERVTVTPKDKSGVTVNVNIGAIRGLSDIDYLVQEVRRKL